MIKDFENSSENSGILLDSFFLSNFLEQAACDIKIVDGNLNSLEYTMIFSEFTTDSARKNLNSAFFAFESSFRFFFSIFLIYLLILIFFFLIFIYNKEKSIYEKNTKLKFWVVRINSEVLS